MLFCVFLFWVCFLCPSLAREVEINILHTTDIHGHLEPVWVEDRGEVAGGLLRCATEIKKIRMQEPNVVLIDCGDLFQGSVESYLSRGAVIAKAVKYLRYDALVVGNHEFDWGIECLDTLYRKTGIPVLTAGIVVNADSPLSNGRPFLVKEIEGVKLVIVGLTNPLIPMWQRPRMLGGLTFPDTCDALRSALAQARKIKPDILVLAVHQGWRQWGDNRANKINQIAKTFPDFDLIIGAHTHQAIEAREVNRIIYTQAGYHALLLGKVSLSYDDQRKKITKIKPRLIAIGEDISPDPDLKKLTADSIRSAKAYSGRKIGENKRELTADSGKNGQSGIQTLISTAIARSVNAEVVLHGVLSPANLKAGVVRMADIWRIVPYENTIGKARLTFDEIREILEQNSRFYGKTKFRGVYGITYELNPRAPLGERVGNLRLSDGRAIKKDDRITFAVNSYDLASGGGRFPRLREIMDGRQAGLEETKKDTRVAVIEYVKKHSPLDIEIAPGAKIVKSRNKILGASFVKREASENTTNASRGTLHMNPD